MNENNGRSVWPPEPTSPQPEITKPRREIDWGRHIPNLLMAVFFLAAFGIVFWFLATMDARNPH